MSANKKNDIPGKTLKAFDEMISGLKGIERKGASMPYTSVNGHMFAFLASDGSLSLRLPQESREAFISKYKTRLSEQHGTVLKEYVLVPDKLFKNAAAIKKYFMESHEYVKSLKPKPAKKPASSRIPDTKLEKTTSKKPANFNPKVEEFILKKNNPLSDEILRVREIILQTSDKIEEDIKWSSPTFLYKGNVASFFMNSKKHVSLMFHYGASLPNKAGLLEGDAAVGRAAKFLDMKDIEKKKKALQSVILEWIKLKDAKL